MKSHSLRFRLLVSAIISVAVALLITGISLVVMFEHHVQRRIGLELETYLNQITAGVDIASNGRLVFDMELADPRFEQALSGLYWQIQDEDRPTLLRSRSLWDSHIELPKDELALGTIHEHVLPGPAKQILLVRERQITLLRNAQKHLIRLAIAADQQGVIQARNSFAADMIPFLAVMAIVLLAAAWIQIRAGLAPLGAIHHSVMGIRMGTKRRLARNYPDEVMPLVDELNDLLDAQEQSIERARAWTADLAHGLKTPLVALTADAQRLRKAGNISIAEDLEQLAETMSRRVDRELIRARIRSGVSKSRVAKPAEIVHRIVRTLQRTPQGEKLEWSLEMDKHIEVSILPEDLTELLGNILENAAKWAKHKVTVAVVAGDAISIRIKDDGPGVAKDQMDQLSLRGVRLDEQRQGSGLGLAIALDIVEAYQGALDFDLTSMGGLAVTVTMPGVTS